MTVPWARVGLAVSWLVSRAVLVWLLTGPQAWVGGDVSYFEASLAVLDDVGPGQVLVEYPLPAVAVVALPWVAALVTGVSYALVLLATAALTDLAFTVLLARGRSGSWPAAVWVLAVPALGATAYARFDLLPGVLAGAATLAVLGRPRLAAAALALATAIKLWPVVLLPSLLAAARRRSVAVVYAGIGGVLALATVAAAGPARLWSPLTYQADRGLQIESVAATPAMVAWWLLPGPWTVAYAPSKAFEITGPGVEVLLASSTLATVAYGAGLVVLWSRLWRQRTLTSPPTWLWCGLTAVLGFMVTGKVLSPQYLLWLLPVAAAGLSVVPGGALRRWSVALVVAAALTQVVFPHGYAAITLGLGSPTVPVLALATRNVLLVLLLGSAAAASWRSLGRDRDPQRGSADERQPPGPVDHEPRTAR